MRIVVSGTHASGKSTLVEAFSVAHPDYLVLSDPIESFDDVAEEPDAGLFLAQLRVASVRLLLPPRAPRVIAERGPLDFLAYLGALEVLGRPTRGEIPDGLRALAVEALASLDLLVLLPLSARARIHVPEDEDPELREAMDEELRELADDSDLVGDLRVVELTGDPTARLAGLASLIGEADQPSRPSPGRATRNQR